MASRTDKLYVIRVKYHIVAITIGKDPREAINNYIAKIGFANPYAYLSNCLMTNTITFITGSNFFSKYYFIDAITRTINDGYPLRISSLWAASCNDIFSTVVPRDISNPLFVRPTIEEVRNCDGFGNASVYELRKFCI